MRMEYSLKGKNKTKYEWILSKHIWKTAHFDANCMEITFLHLKILQFYVFKMAANGGNHFEINIQNENYKSQFISQKLRYSYTFDKDQSLFIMQIIIFWVILWI